MWGTGVWQHSDMSVGEGRGETLLPEKRVECVTQNVKTNRNLANSFAKENRNILGEV